MADARYLRIGGFHPALCNAGLTSSSFTIDAATDKIVVVFQAKTAAAITRLGFRYSLRAGTPVQHRIGLQGVDASGNQDGTYKGGGSPASATFTPPADTTWDGTWQWVTLANSYTPAAPGEFLAYVIEPVGTPDGANNSAFSTVHNNANVNFPYAIHINAGTPTRQVSLPVFGYGGAATVFGYPMQATTAVTLTTATTPDEAALLFSLPSGWGDTYKVRGARINARYQTAAGVHRFVLYDGTTPLQTVDQDSDHIQGTGASRGADVFFDEASLTALSFGQVYRLAVVPQTAAVAIALDTMIQASAAEFEPYSGGVDFCYSSRTDAGAWTDDPARQPHIQLILDDWTEPTGGGHIQTRVFGGM